MFHVLLVDDEELALASLRFALPWTEYGFTDIQTSTSPLDALELLKKQRIDACFVDIRMPGMTGLELLAAARQLKLDTLFVIVSGYSDFSYARQAIQFGVLDYCLKPVVREDCIPVLEKLSKRILTDRLSRDPAYVARLQTEPDFCQQFLSDLTTLRPECRSLTPVLICSDTLLLVLRQADSLLPSCTFFLNRNEALLLWTDALSEDTFASLHSSCPYASFIYGIVSPQANPFQSILKRLRSVCHAPNTDPTGIIKVSSVNEETAAYFSSILSYIESNYAQHLTLQELARQFGINYSYLSQLFKRAINATFAEHLTSVRLTHACHLLSESYMPISDIAEAVGFQDYHYFCNTFKRFYLMTPSQYRNQSRKETKA